MKQFLCVFVAAVGLAVVGARAAPEDAADKERPIIVHVPVIMVFRGQPADIQATITAQNGAVITSAVTQVKLALASKPIEYPMSLSAGDVYKTLIPVSAITGINRFWYFIHSVDSRGHVADTIWHEVRIIDPPDAGGGAAAAGGSGRKTGFWVGGALLGGALLSGGIAIAALDDNGGGGDDPEEPPPAPPPPKKTVVRNIRDDEPCILTGNETVSYNNLGVFDDSGPIEILVCNTCRDADISATGTWEASDAINGYNNPECNRQDMSLRLILEKPDGRPACESQTIQVFANGQLIDSILWPDCSETD